MLFSGKGSCAYSRVHSPKTTKHEAIYVRGPLRKNHRKHLTAIAASFHLVSLNIVLQKAPALKGSGALLFFSNQFKFGGLSSIRIMLCVLVFFTKILKYLFGRSFK